jgi:pSer/pThr/pTyr-binding forkhead associated (FHA) protein
MTQRIELEQLRHALGHPDTMIELESRDGGARIASDFALMERGRAHPLKVGINTVGRLADNDVVLDDPHISRRHCAVLVHSNRSCEVHDIASKNGTYLNGERITCATRVKLGDEIRMCDLSLVLVGGEEPADPATHGETLPPEA